MGKEEYDKVDIGDSFDFDDDLNFDDLDSELNPPPIRDDRNVVVKTSEKFASSAMGEIANPQNLSKLVRNALPKEMQAVHSLADDGLSSVREIYDDVTEQIKGPIKATKKSLRAAKSVMGKVLPDKLDKWLDNILSDDEDSSYVRETKEQQQENQIASVLAENFKWQAEQTQEEKAKEELRAATETEIGRKQAEFLARTMAGVQRLNDYNDGPNLGFQRKMLEVSYRQLFAQQGLLEETKFIRSEFITELRSITKNTALPDLVKQKKSEVMKDMSLRRLIDFGQKSVNGMISEYFPNLKKNLSNVIKQKVGSFNELLGGLQQLADGYTQTNDPSMMLGEQQIIESDRDKLLKGGASVAGMIAGSSLMGMIGSKLRSLIEKNETVKKYSMRLGRFADNPQYYVNKAIREGISPEVLKEKFPWLADKIDDFAMSINPGLREQRGTVGFNKLSNINDIAEFDNRTRLSITDIIPGYLARILQSSEGIRVGTLPPLQVYSHDRQGFITSKELVKDVNAKLFQNYDKERIQRSTNDQRELMFGKDFKMSEQEEAVFNKAMLWRMRNMRGGDIDDLMQSDAFGKEVDEETRKRWQAKIAAEFGYDEETRKLKDDIETYERARKLNDEALSGSKSLPQLLTMIKQRNEGGLQYMEVLKELGLIKEDVTGEFTIDNDAYFKYLMNNDHEKNKKEAEKIRSGGSPTISVGTIPTGAKRITPRKPKGILNGQKTPSSGNTTRGDVLSILTDSRDVLFSLRDNLLSGGKNPSHNASMQANYQTLYVADQKHRESQTTRIVNAITDQSKLFKVEFGQLGQGFEKSLQSSFGNLSHAMDKLMVAAGKVNVDEAMLSRWEKFKDSSKSRWQRGVEWAGKTTGNLATKFASVPGQFKNAGKRMFGAASDTATFLFKQAKKPIGAAFDIFSSQIREDLYVMRNGTLHLALSYAKLVAGSYFDQVTGKTIEKFEKIRNPIMERSPDGIRVHQVVSEEDLENGFYFVNGDKVSMSRFKGLGTRLITSLKEKITGLADAFSPMQQARNALRLAKSTFKKITGFIIDDIYVGDEPTPRITKQGVLNGEYTDAAGNPLSPRHFESLGGDVYIKDPNAANGRRIILTLSEASEKGLFDAKHRPYKSLMGKIKSLLKKPWELAKQGFSMMKNGVKGVLNTVFNAGKFLKRGLTLDAYPKFIYELLAWKFGAPEHHQEALQGNGLFALPAKLFKRVKEFFKLDQLKTAREQAAEKLSKSKSKLLSIRDKLSIEEVRKAAKKAKEDAIRARKEAKEKLIAKREQTKRYLEAKRQAMRDAKDKAKAKFLATRDFLKEKREALANRVGGWRDTLRRRGKSVKKGTGRFLKRTKKGMSNLLLGAVTGIGLVLGKIWTWAKSGFGITKVLKGIWNTTRLFGEGMMKTIRFLGDSISSLARGIGQAGKFLWDNKGAIVDGVKTVGSKALEWGGRAVTYASRVPGAVAAGYSAFMATGTGAAIASGVSAVGSGIAAAGGFLLTNPIGWAILGVAAGVALWQFFKDAFEPLDRFRIMAYGLMPDEHKDHANKLLAFEKEVYKECHFDDKGQPSLGEIDWQKWAGLFWSEDSGQPNESNWPQHVEKFQAWFNNRFQPTFLQHVKNLRRLDPKIEPLDMDDDLDDGLKSSWARSSFIEKTGNGNGPYDFMFSPFSDIQTLDATYRSMEYQRDIIVNKYASDEQKLKDKAAGKRSWLDYTTIGIVKNLFGDSKEEAAAKLSRAETAEKFKDATAELSKQVNKDGKKEEMLTGSLTKVILTNSDGTKKEVTLEESGYKISEAANEFEFINLFLLGMPEEISMADYKTVLEAEFDIQQDLVKTGDVYTYKGEIHEFLEKHASSFGWSMTLDNDRELFGNWVSNRLIPFVCEKKRVALNVNKNVDYNRMASTLEFSELYEIANNLTKFRYKLVGPESRLITFMKCPWKPFKNQSDPATEPVINKWLEALKNRKGKNLSKVLTDEEKEAVKKKFRDGAKAELDKREAFKQGLNEDYQKRLKDSQRNDIWRQQRQTVSDTGYGQGMPGSTAPMPIGNGGIMVDPTGGRIANVNPGTFNANAGPTYQTSWEGSNDIRGITWSPQGQFLDPLAKGAPRDAEAQNFELVKDMFVQVGKVAGVDPGLLAGMAKAESGFNPFAKPYGNVKSSAGGMFMFLDGTWKEMSDKIAKKYGIQNPDRYNPVHAALATAEMIKYNESVYGSSVKAAGLPFDETAVYAGHFLGPGGANKFFKALATNPQMTIAESNGEGVAESNSTLTSYAPGGGRPPWRSVGDVYTLLQKKMQSPYVNTVRQMAGMSPIQVSDANYGLAASNPNYTSSGNVSVGSGGSMANPNYDLRSMPDKGNVQAGGAQDYTAPMPASTPYLGAEANNSAPPSQPLVTPAAAQANLAASGWSASSSTGNTITMGDKAQINNISMIATAPFPAPNSASQINANTNTGNPQVPLANAANGALRMKYNVKVTSEVNKLLEQCTPELEQLGRMYARAEPGVDIQGMEDIWVKLFYNCVGEYVKKTGDRTLFSIYSGFRSPEKQKALYEENVRNNPPNGNGKVARPGRSRHEFGVAMDIRNTGGNGSGKDFEGGLLSRWEQSGVAGKWGFWRRLRPGVNRTIEDWHVENKFFMVNGQPASGQSMGDGDAVNLAMNNGAVPNSVSDAAKEASGNVPVGSGGGLFGSGGLAIDMSRAGIKAAAPTSQALMNGTAQGNVETGSGTTAAQAGQPATVNAGQTPPAPPPLLAAPAPTQTPVQESASTTFIPNNPQTSVQQAMAQPPVDNKAVQVQQQAIAKVDKELVSELEKIGQKQLDVLLSIDGKFDKLIEGVTGLGQVRPQTESASQPEKQPETVGSPRGQAPQIPKDIQTGPLSTSRPKAKM